MEVVKIIELVGVVVAIVFGISSWYYSKKAKKIAEDANKLSEESNKLAKKSIEVSQDANKLSEKSVKIAEETMNKNKENIELTTNGLPMFFVKPIENKNVVLNKDDYSDYLYMSKIRITNRSIQPVTIKDFNCYLGKDNSKISLFITESDRIDIKSYTLGITPIILKNVNSIPIYLNANEMKEIIIAIGIDEADYQQYYAKGGMLIEFTTTSSSKEIFVSSEYTSVH